MAGSYVKGVAAVLPCYWIYWEVGKVLVRRGSSDPRYQQWIATYGGNEFGAIVQEVLDVADRLGARLEPAERTRAGQHFHVTSRYSASQERYGGAASWLRSTSRTMSEDDGGLRLILRKSKTDQEAEGTVRGLPYGSHPATCPVRAWRRWLAVSGIDTGPGVPIRRSSRPPGSHAPQRPGRWPT